MSTQMAERKPQWPETGDFAIATTETAKDYGAYAKMGGQTVFRRGK
jgi:translation initiation factor 2 alpha subunit (eIF-2alpha)